MRTLDALVARTQQLAAEAAPGMNVLERIVASTRDDVRRRREEVPLSPARVRARRARRRPPVLRGADAARRLGDRRAQAPLAVGRHDPRGRDRVRRRARLRARRRGRDLDPHRGQALRRLARRPARGARDLRAADPAQGLHRRPLPALRVGGRGRRRDPADRRRARVAGCSSPSTPRRARWISTCSSRCTTRTSSTARWSSSTPTSSASTTATSATSASTSSAPSSCSPTSRPARPSSRSRASTRASSSTRSSASGVDGVLVGESLMRAPDPEAALRALTGTEHDTGELSL